MYKTLGSIVTDIKYILDDNVDDTINQQLIALLSRCFTKPSDERFKVQRYYNEMPQHRWYIKSPSEDAIIAHLAVHEKTVRIGSQQALIGGVAEVCVHPNYRGHGYVKLLLKQAHNWMAQQGYVYSVLFGRDEVYSSSGYERVTNLYLVGEEIPPRATSVSAMVTPLTDKKWPHFKVELKGLAF
ncbi:hypothetical protein VSAK1_17372 [Vibrio mediterranei AK1]|nr:hypothetical protein VSAK1_17372 [Vibrio mediterranei AK1]